MTLSFMLSAYLFGPSLKTIIISLLTFATIIIVVVDLEHYIIPDEMNLLIFALGLIYGYFNNEGIEQLLFMPLGFFAFAMFLRYLMFFWKKKEGLGFGDVKFFIAAGTFIDMALFPTFLLLSGVFGIVIALVWRLMKKGEVFPFGPALALSLLFCVAFPQTGLNFISLVNEIIQ